MEAAPEHYEVTLVDRERQTRFPRSKKRRIRRKWTNNRSNWEPMMVPVSHAVILGSAFTGVGTEKLKEQLHRRLEMHTKLWGWIQVHRPELAERCAIVEPIPPFQFTSRP